MSKSLLFILNPRSGHGQVLSVLADVLDIMVKADFEVRVYTTQCQGDATRIVKEEGNRYDRIICSGGDGTLGEVVKGVIDGGIDRPIGYIPAGSTNDFAISLGLPCDDPRLAASIAVGETFMDCDAAEFCGEKFLYAAAFGLFSATSYATPQPLKNVLGHLAYVLEGSKELRDVPDYTIGNIKIVGEYEVVKDLDIGQVFGNITAGINDVRDEYKNAGGENNNLFDKVGAAIALSANKSVKKASERILEPQTQVIAVENSDSDDRKSDSLLGKYILGMITNSSSIGGIQGITGKRVDMRDGMFEMTLIKRPDNIIEMNHIASALSNVGLATNFESPMVRRIKASEIEIEFVEPVAFTLDGEFGGEHKAVSIKTIPSAFKIFVEHKE